MPDKVIMLETWGDSRMLLDNIVVAGVQHQRGSKEWKPMGGSHEVLQSLSGPLPRQAARNSPTVPAECYISSRIGALGPGSRVGFGVTVSSRS